MDGESAAGRYLCGGCSSVGGYCVFHDGEAEARAAQFATAALVDTVEALEETVEVLRLYARAVVADQELVSLEVIELILLKSSSYDTESTKGTAFLISKIVTVFKSFLSRNTQ